MPASKAQQKAVTKYMKAKYDEIKVRVEKGQKDTIQTHAAERCESVNGFIGRAISETMTRDRGGTASEIAGKPAESAQGAGVVPLLPEAFKATQEAAEVGDMPFPVDKELAAGELLTILGDLGTVDLERDKCERLGIVYLPPDTLRAAQEAAEAAGETVSSFVSRAVEQCIPRKVKVVTVSEEVAPKSIEVTIKEA